MPLHSHHGRRPPGVAGDVHASASRAVIQPANADPKPHTQGHALTRRQSGPRAVFPHTHNTPGNIKYGRYTAHTMSATNRPITNSKNGSRILAKTLML